MRIAVSGSIATDHLMVFPGSFTDQFVQDRLDKVSLSFLVDDLEIRHGGVAANISYGLSGLGLAPVLVGSAGRDFGPYRTRLKENGVDTDFVHVSPDRPTARFMCMTDREHHRIATFYSGAMAEACDIDLRQVIGQAGDVGAVVISPNDPGAMIRHTEQARSLGLPFAADPSQQLALMGRDEARQLVAGARWLFTDECEASLLEERTGRRHDDILSRVGVWLTTLGAQGVRMEVAGRPMRTVPAVPPTVTADPTGAGDAFCAGFMAAVTWGAGLELSARTGCALASFALEGSGAQGYVVDPEALLQRMEISYGMASARAISPHLEKLSCPLTLGADLARRPGHQADDTGRTSGDSAPVCADAAVIRRRW